MRNIAGGLAGAPLTRHNWPIGAALLQFPSTGEDGRHVNDAPVETWMAVFEEVRDAGFDYVDFFDGWVRPADLSKERLHELSQAAEHCGLKVPAISVIRRSVIDPDSRRAADNLAYSHRTVDAAAELGIPVVSVGLHRDLTPEQQQLLWFWTVQGATDPAGDTEVWNACVTRLRELAQHGQQVGVEISLEMYEDTYIGTADSALRLLADIDHDWIGLNPDLGNLIRVQGPIEPWESMVAKTIPHANYWHMKNYFRSEDPHTGAVFTTPAPMEFGFLSYRSAVKLALATGFRGTFCVEHYGGDGLSVSATNRDYLRRLLPETIPARNDDGLKARS